MNVDAPMWSATTGRSALNAGAIDILSAFHFSTSLFASSLSIASSARSPSRPLPSAISSPRSASRCWAASGASNRAASALTRSRYAVPSSPIRQRLRAGAVESDALRGREQPLDVEEDHELLVHPDDPLEVLARESAKQSRRRRDGRRIERRDRGDRVDDGADPFPAAVQDEDARLVAHLDVGHLESAPQVDDWNYAALIIDDALDVLGHVGHRRGLHVSQHAF